MPVLGSFKEKKTNQKTHKNEFKDRESAANFSQCKVIADCILVIIFLIFHV